MNAWDFRTLLRALGAAMVGLAVVWLVTAASDEGQLTVGVRAGRTLPVAPLCSAVGAALALGSARVRGEASALETLGRTPERSALAAALGAALPSILVALVLAFRTDVDVSGFYPTPHRGDAWTTDQGAFVSKTLGVRVAPDGELEVLAATSEAEIAPAGGRAAAALATGLAGIALALVTGRVMLRQSLLDRGGRRRRRIVACAEGLACAVATLVAFQAAAARLSPAWLAVVPSLLLLVVAAVRYRPRDEHAVGGGARG